MKKLDFSKLDLTYSELESRYGQLYMMNYLYPELKLGKNHSPLRVDSNPSFVIGENYGKIYWKDMRTGESGNLYTLIQKREATVYNFYSCLAFINNQLRSLNIQPNFDKSILPKNKTNPFKIGVVRRDWVQHDIDYWKQFGISIATLEFYRVSPITWIYLWPNTDREVVIKADKHAYAFKELKDNIVNLKTYQPYSLTAKWFSDCLEQHSAWSGWTQMDQKADTLIWTKSLKDVMSIKETAGINSVCLQSESWLPKQNVVDELKLRFKTIFILYDQDFDSIENWGHNLGQKLSTMFNIQQIEIPLQYQCKDYSDLYKKYKQEAINILKQLIINENNN